MSLDILDRTKPAPRRRFDGPLCARVRAACRDAGKALAYDPAQTGWVRLDSVDDSETAARMATPVVVRFRPWRADDLDHFHALLDDPAVWTFLPQPYPAPLRRSDAATLLDLARSGTHHMVHAVELGGAPIGQARLEFGGAGQAEISYWLGRAYWGQGLGHEVVRGYTRLAFAEAADIHTLLARVDRRNVASRRVLTGAGYRYDGPEPRDPALDLFSRGRQ